MLTKKELMEMWERPRERQVNVMLSKILEAFSETNGKIAVCFSGGKDSAYLLFKVAQAYKDLPDWTEQKLPLVVVFADTTNEHGVTRAYISEYIKFIEDNFKIKILFKITRPADKQTFATVLRYNGIPLISKDVIRTIRRLRLDLDKNGLTFKDIEPYSKQTFENVKKLQSMGLSATSILTLTGYITKDNKFGKSFRLAKRWYPLVDERSIEVSEICCEILKKAPMRIMLAELGGYQPMIGEMAQDSEKRMNSYLQTGCNNFIDGKGKSKPMGAMTEQALLWGIDLDNVPMCEYYGDLVCENGIYKFTKECRGGCALCGFGICFDNDRFLRLQKTEPAKVNWAFTPKDKGGAGYLEAVTFLNEKCKCKIKIPEIREIDYRKIK